MLMKKVVTIQKRGETRALFLGLGMVVCSMMMYFFIGVTIVPFYTESVWTKETTCKVLNANIKDEAQCLFNNGAGNVNNFPYPCLEVLVDLNFSGQEVMLYHTEDTHRRNPKCSYIPKNLKNDTEVKMLLKEVAEKFRKSRPFPCYYDPEGRQTSALFTRLYPTKDLLFPFLWPSFMLTGGVLIIIMVKVSQYVSVLSAWQHRTNL
ncbi:calcium-activated potassium channel subunit beta-1 [Carettochelys insculpta]|uniref:calcium-activated potassium channel subunit beta-1 n=1 Tax=Carettochelys insculpta TaxID=44489 RepID=UPI003EBBBBEA